MKFEAFQNTYHLPDFHAQQRKAIEAVDGPVLLLAVPGSGKTTVLVARLGYMVHVRHIAPEQILTLTYTVAATADMRSRFARYFGQDLAERMEFRTINGLCQQIIQRYGYLHNKGAAFDLIAEEGEKTRILAPICAELMDEYPTDSELKEIATGITCIKNSLLTAEQALQAYRDSELPVYDIYLRYCDTLRQQRKMDYDDQMVYAYTMLQRDRTLLREYQQRFRYICVDEAQDTSRIQHEIIRLLAAEHENLFMVGDEDQSIYGFRAAYPKALLHFEKDHPNATVLLMEQNYRSTGAIVALADRVIRHNRQRHAKTIHAARNEAGTALDIHSVKQRRGQYVLLHAVAQSCRQQTAVLYRDHDSALPLIDRLERSGTDYRMKPAAVPFFSNRMVRDVRNFVRLMENPRDTEAFRRVYPQMNCYLKREQVERACVLSAARNTDILQVLQQDPSMKPRVRQNVQAYQTLFRDMRHASAAEALNMLLYHSEYGTYLDRCHYFNQYDRLEILKELSIPEASLKSLVKRLDELERIIRNKTENRDCPFILSTIHGSKGLEYDTVYLLDIKDGIFPRQDMDEKHSAAQRQELEEEERRLFYVGITRARNHLHVFRIERGKSRFLDELQGITAQNGAKPQGSGRKTIRQVTPDRQLELYRQKLAATRTVHHKTMGKGTVQTVQDNTVTIVFRTGKKTLDIATLMEKQLLTFGVQRQ